MRLFKRNRLKRKLIAEIAWIDDQYWPSMSHGSVKEVRNRLARMVGVKAI